MERASGHRQACVDWPGKPLSSILVAGCSSPPRPQRHRRDFLVDRRCGPRRSGFAPSPPARFAFRNGPSPAARDLWGRVRLAGMIARAAPSNRGRSRDRRRRPPRSGCGRSRRWPRSGHRNQPCRRRNSCWCGRRHAQGSTRDPGEMAASARVEIYGLSSMSSLALTSAPARSPAGATILSMGRRTARDASVANSSRRRSGPSRAATDRSGIVDCRGIEKLGLVHGFPEAVTVRQKTQNETQDDGGIFGTVASRSMPGTPTAPIDMSPTFIGSVCRPGATRYRSYGPSHAASELPFEGPSPSPRKLRLALRQAHQRAPTSR